MSEGQPGGSPPKFTYQGSEHDTQFPSLQESNSSGRQKKQRQLEDRTNAAENVQAQQHHPRVRQLSASSSGSRGHSYHTVNSNHNNRGYQNSRQGGPPGSYRNRTFSNTDVSETNLQSKSDHDQHRPFHPRQDHRGFAQNRNTYSEFSGEGGHRGRGSGGYRANQFGHEQANREHDYSQNQHRGYDGPRNNFGGNRDNFGGNRDNFGENRVNFGGNRDNFGGNRGYGRGGYAQSGDRRGQHQGDQFNRQVYHGNNRRSYGGEHMADGGQEYRQPGGSDSRNEYNNRSFHPGGGRGRNTSFRGGRGNVSGSSNDGNWRSDQHGEFSRGEVSDTNTKAPTSDRSRTKSWSEEVAVLDSDANHKAAIIKSMEPPAGFAQTDVAQNNGEVCESTGSSDKLPENVGSPTKHPIVEKMDGETFMKIAVESQMEQKAQDCENVCQPPGRKERMEKAILKSAGIEHIEPSNPAEVFDSILSGGGPYGAPPPGCRVERTCQDDDQSKYVNQNEAPASKENGAVEGSAHPQKNAQDPPNRNAYPKDKNQGPHRQETNRHGNEHPGKAKNDMDRKRNVGAGPSTETLNYTYEGQKDSAGKLLAGGINERMFTALRHTFGPPVKDVEKVANQLQDNFLYVEAVNTLKRFVHYKDDTASFTDDDLAKAFKTTKASCDAYRDDLKELTEIFEEARTKARKHGFFDMQNWNFAERTVRNIFEKPYAPKKEAEPAKKSGDDNEAKLSSESDQKCAMKEGDSGSKKPIEPPEANDAIDALSKSVAMIEEKYAKKIDDLSQQVLSLTQQMFSQSQEILSLKQIVAALGVPVLKTVEEVIVEAAEPVSVETAAPNAEEPSGDKLEEAPQPCEESCSEKK